MTFETGRLILKPLTMADHEAVFHTLNYEKSVDSIYLFEWPLTTEQAKRWCARAEKGAETDLEHIFLVTSKEQKEPVGCIGLHYFSDEHERAEIGYWLDEKHHGKGYASEMLEAIVAHAFAQERIKEVFATTAMDNGASQALLQKAGFSHSDVVEIEKSPGVTRSSRKFVLYRS